MTVSKERAVLSGDRRYRRGANSGDNKEISIGQETHCSWKRGGNAPDWSRSVICINVTVHAEVSEEGGSNSR